MSRKKYIECSDEQLAEIYDSGKEETINFLKTLIDKINDLAIQVEDLKEQISKDSHNSNKPPSSDGPFKKQTKSMRKKGGKSGGQKGHKGTNLKMSDNPDEIIIIKVKGKCSCGKAKSSSKKAGIEKRQVFDLPKITMKITEYQADIIECDCGQVHSAVFPSNVKVKAQYGNNIKSLSVYLKHYGFLSYERIAEFMKDIVGQNISQGTLVNMVNECAAKLLFSVKKIKEKLTREDVVHFDETGFRIEGSLHWLHSAGNDNYTYYYPHKKRGKQAMDDMGILPLFRGIAVHDHWDSYYRYIHCNHSLCNSHHLRELIFFDEQNEIWAGKLIDCLLDAKYEKENNKKLSLKRQKYYRQRMHRILNMGLKIHPEIKVKKRQRGRPAQSKAHNILRRMKNRIDDVLRFIYELAVPFDNNLAERDVRMTKVQQKISGTFRSFQGAESFCIIRSYLSTARKQGLSVFKAISRGFQNNYIIASTNC